MLSNNFLWLLIQATILFPMKARLASAYWNVLYHLFVNKPLKRPQEIMPWSVRYNEMKQTKCDFSSLLKLNSVGIFWHRQTNKIYTRGHLDHPKFCLIQRD